MDTHDFSQQAYDYQRIEHAIRYVEAHFTDTISIQALSENVYWRSRIPLSSSLTNTSMA